MDGEEEDALRTEVAARLGRGRDGHTRGGRELLGGTGRANWFAALRTLQQGGGGAGIMQETLVKA